MRGEMEGSLDDFLFPDYVRDVRTLLVCSSGKKSLIAFIFSQSIRNEALTLKASFLCIGKICEAYTDVSNRYILPGLETIDRLALTSTSLSMEQVEQRSLQLQREYTEPAVKGIDDITQRVRLNLHRDAPDRMLTPIVSTEGRAAGIWSPCALDEQRYSEVAWGSGKFVNSIPISSAARRQSGRGGGGKQKIV